MGGVIGAVGNKFAGSLVLPPDTNRNTDDRYIDVGLGRIVLHIPKDQVDMQDQEETGSVLGLRAFYGRRIVLDLPHHILWVGPDAGSRP